MNRILVGLDASPRATQVLEAATALAQKTGAKLTVLRAVGVPVELPVQAYTLPPGSLAELLERDAQRSLEEQTRPVPAGLIERLLVKVGTPWQVICDVAREQKADLIVIGSHGHGVLDRVLGTTAGRVVNHTDRSVLVVRAPE